jgi:hypothetical protein
MRLTDPLPDLSPGNGLHTTDDFEELKLAKRHQELAAHINWQDIPSPGNGRRDR